ncbi:MAG: AI-2E family transporter, partial [candidate division Zixibacteria bacterium]|nr:AI-2E family transporter [candidate division Zixibacteria bacterium]
MLSDRQFTFDRVIRLLIAAGVVWGVLQLLDYLSDVLIPFAIALLLAYLINPLVDGIQRGFRLKSRPLAVAVGLLLFTLVVAGAAAAILPLVLDELARMRKLLAAVIEDAAMRDTAVRRLPEIVWRYVSEALSDEKVRELITFSNIREVLQRVLPGVWGVFSGAMSLLFGLLGFVVVGIYLVFILMDYRAVTEGWKELIPPPYRARVIDVVG